MKPECVTAQKSLCCGVLQSDISKSILEKTNKGHSKGAEANALLPCLLFYLKNWRVRNEWITGKRSGNTGKRSWCNI